MDHRGFLYREHANEYEGRADFYAPLDTRRLEERFQGYGISSALLSGDVPQKARLRTRVGADGMDYKGFNIAVHEMGHNVEQVISLDDVDYTLLKGVPNTAFTEPPHFSGATRGIPVHR